MPSKFELNCLAAPLLTSAIMTLVAMPSFAQDTIVAINDGRPVTDVPSVDVFVPLRE